MGHSYGGAVVTQAAAGRHDIGHLVDVAAFALDDGESVLGALGSFARRTVDLAAATVPLADGSGTTLDPAAAAGALYASCSPEVVAAAVRRLGAQPYSTMIEPVTGSPRGSIDSTYVRCDRDRAVHPDHQAIMAARCGRGVDLDTDHSPFLSAPAELADIVAPVAAALGVPAS